MTIEVKILSNLQEHTHKLVQFHDLNITVPSWANYAWMNSAGVVYASNELGFNTEGNPSPSGLKDIVKIGKFRVLPKFAQDYVKSQLGNLTLTEISEDDVVFQFESLEEEEDFRESCVIPKHNYVEEGFFNFVRFLSLRLPVLKSHRFVAIDGDGSIYSYLREPRWEEEINEWCIGASDYQLVGVLELSGRNKEILDRIARYSLTVVTH